MNFFYNLKLWNKLITQLDKPTVILARDKYLASKKSQVTAGNIPNYNTHMMILDQMDGYRIFKIYKILWTFF
jgi:hypothetical protein